MSIWKYNVSKNKNFRLPEKKHRLKGQIKLVMSTYGKQMFFEKL